MYIYIYIHIYIYIYAHSYYHDSKRNNDNNNDNNDTVDFRNFIVFLLGRNPSTLKSDIASKNHPQLICSDLRLSD